MTVYLSGPMSNMPDHNYPLFASVSATLRASGYTVISPHELGLQEQPWRVCMRVCLRALLDDQVEVIVRLPGWRASRGAVVENIVARVIGLDVLVWPFQVLGHPLRQAP